MEWPARRFEIAFEIWMTRRLVEEWDQRKLAHLAGVYGNSNYDPEKEGEESPRAAMVQQIEENYEEVKRAIRAGPTKKVEDSVSEDNPFMAASKRNMMRVLAPHIEGEEEAREILGMK